MAARTVRWGVLGCARVACKAMIPGIQGSCNGRVVALGSRSLEKARAVAADFSIDRPYGSYLQVLEDPEVDAVYIPLPNALHKEWTIRAAEHGKQALCDKPLAGDAGEATEMIEACSRNGVRLMELFANRFHPQNLEIRKCIEDGQIGKILGMTASHSSDFPPAGDIRLSRELKGGVLMDKGCYNVNMARFLFGAEPVRVYARMQIHPEAGVDVWTTATLEFAGGGSAHLDCNFSLGSGVYSQSYQVFGERGQIFAPKGYTQVETYREGTLEGSSYYVSDTAAVNPSWERIDCEGVHQWRQAVEFFSDVLLQDRPLSFPAENGLANMRVIDAIFRSARLGQPVSLST